MAEHQQAAFLLHSRPFKENQLLLDLLTEHDGKVSALIYSGNSVKSNKKAILQPFSPLLIAYKGQSSLKKMTLVEADGKSFQFRGNYLYSAFYLNELLVRLLGDAIPCPELFHHFKLSLQALNEQEPIEVVLRHFEMTLLEELGLTIDFTCLDYESMPYVNYIAEQGFVAAINNSVKPCYDKQHLLAIAEQKLLSKEELFTFKLLMRQIMAPLLGNKPLNSRKFFTQK
ncbi:MAG: DNA repair protein RecO [Thalassotalea sp.]